mmetsp:Transcript_36774/g.64766  ORF Transcript_36774/g.64766 Transcript_36774/m.64766 type:complete len:333 (+) Transcript_36774:65-1063(+)
MVLRLISSAFMVGSASTFAPVFNAKTRASEVRTTFGAAPTYLSQGATIVTGGNSGIGLESVKELLKGGCKVVLCSRSVAAGEAALASLEGVDTSLARVQKLDLADLDSVREAADEIVKHDPQIALLLNNAGIMATPQGETKQGFEMQIGVNHLGHHALTRLLLPAMVDGGRVVTLASTAHSFGSVDTGDLFFKTRKYKPWAAYGQSKAANILFAKGLADKLAEAGSNILSVSLHPGVIGTPLWRHGNQVLTWLALKVITDKDVSQGAATSVYAALAPAEDLVPGAYLSDCAIAIPNAECSDESRSGRQALWDTSERLIAEAGLALPKSLRAT